MPATLRVPSAARGRQEPTTVVPDDQLKLSAKELDEEITRYGAGAGLRTIARWCPASRVRPRRSPPHAGW